MSDRILKDVIAEATAILAEAEVDSPALSAQLLAEKAFGLDRLQLIMEMPSPVDSAKVEEFNDSVSRRAKGEPVAYILGVKEFFGLDFKVGPGVLIPRPETEEIVEKVQQLFSISDSFTFADFGCGSGILAVTIASLFPESYCVAMDLSEEALAIAYDNAVSHGVDDRVQLVRADFNKPILSDSSLDMVLANPPYLAESELAEISYEVADFEPVSALVSGVDGDEDIRGSAPHIASALKSGGIMFMEIGYLQGEVAHQVFDQQNVFTGNVHVEKDISGHDRIVVAKKR